MRFEQLIEKVKQAENVLEARERSVSTHLRQLKQSWLDAWTPGRIVVAGLVSGFLVGTAEPMRAFGKSGGLMQLATMLSGLFAGGSAQAAASEAAHAAGSAQQAAAAADPEAEALARAEAAMQAARAAASEPIDP
ncbi:hypothetical protein [Lysobacter niastensis]|uniref:Protein sip-5 n=1 Tax=Lysobacter niastensis TaxID=380629 RepID=A0ABS0B7V7_9GAMM|nr:hypothetical protein [Lysobacter niastensis]MBF6025119.1 hypothetical protein [Lysobacter niastensis]